MSRMVDTSAIGVQAICVRRGAQKLQTLSPWTSQLGPVSRKLVVMILVTTPASGGRRMTRSVGAGSGLSMVASGDRYTVVPGKGTLVARAWELVAASAAAAVVAKMCFSMEIRMSVPC